MWIYVNSCEFIDNKWCFNNKKYLGGLGKNLKVVSLRYFNPLISKHTKNLFSKLGFIKRHFKSSKINKLGNFGFLILRFWPRPLTYLYYCQPTMVAKIFSNLVPHSLHLHPHLHYFSAAAALSQRMLDS